MSPSVVMVGQQTKSPGPWSGGGAADQFTKLNTHMPPRRRIRNVRGHGAQPRASLTLEAVSRTYGAIHRNLRNVHGHLPNSTCKANPW